MEESVFSGIGIPLKKVMDYKKIYMHQIFQYPKTKFLTVSEKIKKEVQKAGCTGVKFEKVAVSD